MGAIDEQHIKYYGCSFLYFRNRDFFLYTEEVPWGPLELLGFGLVSESSGRIHIKNTSQVTKDKVFSSFDCLEEVMNFLSLILFKQK